MIFVKTSVRNSKLADKGLFLDEAIKRGAKVLEFTGKKLTFQQVKDLGYQEHAHPVGLDLYVDNHNPMPESYVNHSCNPTMGFSNTSTLIALKDLNAGDEITFDYSLITADNWHMICHCGSKKCRKIIGNYVDLPEEVKQKYRSVTPAWTKKLP